MFYLHCSVCKCPEIPFLNLKGFERQNLRSWTINTCMDFPVVLVSMLSECHKHINGCEFTIPLWSKKLVPMWPTRLGIFVPKSYPSSQSPPSPCFSEIWKSYLTHRNKVFYTRKKRHYSLDCPDEETIENLVYRSLTQDKHVKCDISAQTINAIQGEARQLCWQAI